MSHEEGEEKRASPLQHMSFLPELKVRREDDSMINFRKKRSELKIPQITNLLKISTECKPRVIELQHNVGLPHDNFYENYSFKNHIKLRNAASKSTLTKPRTPSTDIAQKKAGPQVIGS
ncbi:MAG: hypothetical protein V2I33_23735, partial [Kangiellaceae bacterium]|nr:hypothetical protein [Kangiellaceae bacterium]